MTAYDTASFSAGRDCGTRVAASVARLAALELMDHSRWWNRWRRRLMAGALVACAQELEGAAEEDRRDATAELERGPISPRVGGAAAYRAARARP